MDATDKMENNDKKQLGIDIKAEVAQGTYSNLAIIAHSHSEFVIDFAAMLPGMPKPQVQNRIIMTPEHAKRLFLALQDNVIKYEEAFGNIQLDVAPKPKGTFNFNDFGGFGGNNPDKS